MAVDTLPNRHENRSARHESSASGSNGSGGGFSLLELAVVVVDYRSLIGLSALAGAALFILGATLAANTYTAQGAFMPEGGSAPSGGVASLAAQFGVDVAAGATQRSAPFYASLLKSREILMPIVSDTFRIETEAGAVTGTLAEIFPVEGESLREREELALEHLRAILFVSTNYEIGLVSFAVRATSADLAHQIAVRVLDRLNEYSLELNRATAIAERGFTADRLAEATRELADAELELQRFLQRNRSFANAPELLFEHDRLQRQVGMRQQLVTSLSQAYDQARINAARNTPAIAVVERPVPPVYRDAKRRVTKGVLGLVLGGSAGLLLALSLDYLRRLRLQDPERYALVAGLASEVYGDVRRLRNVPRLVGSRTRAGTPGSEG